MSMKLIAMINGFILIMIMNRKLMIYRSNRNTFELTLIVILKKITSINMKSKILSSLKLNFYR